ncbi:MAG: cytochrome P450, partial [Rivularia sp. ALOHA_DT_140]|nr:cytochrome P450 [Rivularia sp. ALOHA_DT_140]
MSLPNTLNKPVLLQRLQWVNNPVEYMEDAVERYPDIFAADIIPSDDKIVFVNQPEAIQKILTNDRNKFIASGKGNQILQPLLGKSSIVMLGGEPHKRQRQLLVP